MKKLADGTREFFINDRRFLIVESMGDKYEVKTWHEKFNSMCKFAERFTLKDCKDVANLFEKNGGWDEWMK